jgi:hypothetical protein
VGHLAAEGRLGEVASLSLMVVALDNERAGDAAAFTGRDTAAAAVAASARRGYLDGQALSGVFTWLRPNDSVWNYVVNNYLLGKEPPAFDVLYWNQDAVRLAAGLHRDFIRIGLDNALVEPGAAEVLGSGVDLGAIDVDSYVVAASPTTSSRGRARTAARSCSAGSPASCSRPAGTSRRSSIRPRPRAGRATASPTSRRSTRRRGRSPRPRGRAAGGPTTTSGSRRAPAT